MSHWANNLVGLPWNPRGSDHSGVDCWGLCWMALQANDVQAPRYQEEYACDRELHQVEDIVNKKTTLDPCLHPVKVGEERELDLLTFRVMGHVCHIGIVVGKNQMLHIHHGSISCIENYKGNRWESRLTGIYRIV